MTLHFDMGVDFIVEKYHIDIRVGAYTSPPYPFEAFLSP